MSLITHPHFVQISINWSIGVILLSTQQPRIWHSGTYKGSYNTIIRSDPWFDCIWSPHGHVTWYVIAFHYGNSDSSRTLLFARSSVCVQVSNTPHAAEASANKVRTLKSYCHTHLIPVVMRIQIRTSHARWLGLISNFLNLGHSLMDLFEYFFSRVTSKKRLNLCVTIKSLMLQQHCNIDEAEALCT